MGRRQLWRERLAHLRLPVLTSLAAKGILDERLPHAAGVFTGDGGTLSPEYSLLHETDLVVGLGLRNFEILNPSALSGPLVLVDNVQSDAGIGFAASAACSSATPEQIGELLDCLGSRSWGLDATGSAHAVLRRRLLDHPWLPPALFAVLEDLLPHAVFVADTGAFCTVAEHLWRARDQDGFLCSANGRYMGTSVPMAIGAALAQPERPVICAMGDGGVRIYFPEIKLALQHKLPILFLLLSDGCYGSIAAAVPAAQRRAEVLSIGKPSWVEAGIALGCPGARVEDGAALRAMVKQWRTADGPSFLEAHFDPNAYLTMTEGLR